VAMVIKSSIVDYKQHKITLACEIFFSK